MLINSITMKTINVQLNRCTKQWHNTTAIVASINPSFGLGYEDISM